MSETVTKDTTSKGRLLERDRHTYKRTGRKKYKTKQENQKGATKAQRHHNFKNSTTL